MKTKTTHIFIILAMACLVLWAIAPVLAGEGTITGKVTEDLQIITTDGDVYDASASEKSDELMAHVGKTVEATGTLSEEDGGKTITVTQFKVVGE